MGRYLKRCGFSPQKPVRRAFEQKPDEVRQWLDKAYPSTQKQAKREKSKSFGEMRLACAQTLPLVVPMVFVVKHR
jgi:hypothetical protein